MRSLNQILHKSKTVLPKILSKTEQLQELNQIFYQFLDRELAQHCRLAELKEKEIVIVADNSSWVTKLRYAMPEVLKNIIQHPCFKSIKKAHYRIKDDTEMLQTPLPKAAKPPISPQNLKLWKATLAKLNKLKVDIVNE